MNMIYEVILSEHVYVVQYCKQMHAG